MDAGRRVVITGMGVTTVLGDSLEAYWDGLVSGRSGITRWRKFDDPRCYSKIGGDLSEFNLKAHLSRVGASYPQALVRQCQSLLRSTPPSGHLVTAAALQAYVDAGLDGTVQPERTGHILSGHNLNARYIRENLLTYLEEPDYVEPLFGLLCLDSDVLSVVCELLALRGPSFTVGGACASGSLGLMAGLDMVRGGRVDAVMVTGGAVDLEPGILHGWALIEAISCRTFDEEPARASRPFDGLRDGFVPSEGAGAIVLESLSSARSRGARIYAEVLGASSASDGSRLPRPSREGQVRAMSLALSDAHVRPEQIDYINAHATSTPLGDLVEVEAIKVLLGERAYRIPVNGTKSMIGHCLCAAGVVELIATVLQIEHGVVHPTINQEQTDPELDLDFVPNAAREARIDIALSNSFGFGGLNSSVVVGRAA